MKLVSVIVTTYNRVGLLKEALTSVAAQDYPEFEVLVCDDGSDQDSAAVLPDGRFRLLRLQHQGLPAPGRNLGLEEARGELVAFLDDDDLWEPHKLSRQVALLETHRELAVVSSNARLFPGPALPWNWCPWARRPSLAELMAGNTVALSSVLARKQTFQVLGGFDEDPELAGVEDLDLWLRLLVRCPQSILVEPRPLIRYRVQESSLSAGSELDRVLKVLAKHEARYSAAVEEAELHHRRRDQLRRLRQELYAQGALRSGFLAKAGPGRLDTWLVLARFWLSRCVSNCHEENVPNS